MNLKNIINAVKVTKLIKSISKQNNWTNSIEIEKYLKYKKNYGP